MEVGKKDLSAIAGDASKLGSKLRKIVKVAGDKGGQQEVGGMGGQWEGCRVAHQDGCGGSQLFSCAPDHLR